MSQSFDPTISSQNSVAFDAGTCSFVHVFAAKTYQAVWCVNTSLKSKQWEQIELVDHAILILNLTNHEKETSLIACSW